MLSYEYSILSSKNIRAAHSFLWTKTYKRFFEMKISVDPEKSRRAQNVQNPTKT